MNSVANALQPLLNLFSLFNIVMLIIFSVIGFMSAFYLEEFIRSILVAFFLIFFASALSKLLPGLLPGMTNYVLMLTVGFIIGKFSKWIIQYFCKREI
ncbi:hypothetical protein PQG02_31985 (plasmid) [Nostoc sp. UHCC 0926]|uniref:hypothetical protein n=1 Tax=Nostoc sp. UHCC 0926 TaxID=3025190 RepID=UPI002362CB1F|nr:hypothetical protein [Nostoc sp. UHCC 0926]WDD36023.1 hypothetical protein PQG02_31985 [Nostoc sp. UHCC 0926]